MAIKNSPKERSGLSDTIRTVILAIIFIAAIPLTVLAVIYALNLKEDVGVIRRNTTVVRENSAKQLEVTQRQAELAEQQLEISRTLVELAEQQLETSRLLLSEAEESDAKLSRSLGIQQQLLDTARATLQQTREINRKMPPSLSPAVQITDQNPLGL